MAALSPKPNRRYNVRSVSFPAKSYPTVLGIIEEELKKLQSLEASPSSSKADAICSALSSILKLCVHIEVLLSLPLTQQNLSQNERCLSEFVDISLRFLDVCSHTRDAIVSMKETA
ncbi:hypothetical protein HS088_TW01G01010 [Tripterygium wilfordii]|uniref:Uncharacterized protein n=1 Tax=Tripterygium wilfordii TaxID=458696 RepID=A0A7J7E3J6_TRIWF|nr:hypothetical protein HS088_TW01G01010 [Tripterygium wilfordii]